MKIKTQIDPQYKQPEIHVCNHEMTPRVSELVEQLNRIFSDQFMGTDERGNRCMLSVEKICRIYASGQKVFAQIAGNTYSISKKLYELEKELDAALFIRISKSEIINIHKIKKLDMSMAGTIKVIMEDGTESYTSRRNVARLKKALL